MSAWIVSEKHVLTLAYFYEKCFNKLTDSTLIKKTARILWNENIKSVNYRYNETNKRSVSKNWLDLIDEKISNESLIKQINCWEYQSCEHPGFYKSKAYEMMKDLKIVLLNEIVSKTTAYELAPWGI